MKRRILPGMTLSARASSVVSAMPLQAHVPRKFRHILINDGDLTPDMGVCAKCGEKAVIESPCTSLFTGKTVQMKRCKTCQFAEDVYKAP